MILDERALWGVDEICAYASFSERWVRKVVAQPDFPAPIRIFERSHPRWRAGEVMAYFEARQEAA